MPWVTRGTGTLGVGQRGAAQPPAAGHGNAFKWQSRTGAFAFSLGNAVRPLK